MYENLATPALLPNQNPQNQLHQTKKLPPPSDLKPTKNQLHQTKNQKNQKNFDRIRFRGISEKKKNSSRERYEHDLKQVKEVSKHLKVTSNVIDLK